MTLVLPANQKESFGARLGANIGAGLSAGVTQAAQFAQEMAQEKYKREQKMNLVADIQKRARGQSIQAPNKPSFKDQIAPEQIDATLQHIENTLGFKLTPEQQAHAVQMMTGGDQEDMRDPFLESEMFAAADLPEMSKVATERAKHGFDVKKEATRKQERQEDIARASREKKAAETAKIREDYALKGTAARKGIQNKNKMIQLIKSGNIDDPTYATIAEMIPNRLGERLLSPDTVAYKAAMVDEFTDLRNIFQGQTRVKEIDILEDKIAGLYLTDEQKEAVLASRLESLKADIIREEAAAFVEENYPGAGLLEFNKRVNEIAEPKLEKLFGKILDDQKSIIDQAERRKQVPLNADDPEDNQILKQLLIEAGGNKDTARKLAKKKGYTL